MKTINHECYLSSEVTELLTKAGFYWQDYFVAHNISGRFNWEIPLHIAQKWLRDVHYLHITIFSSSQESWMFRVTKQHQKLEKGAYGEDFYTYEEALEAAIKKALEIILEKGDYEKDIRMG